MMKKKNIAVAMAAVTVAGTVAPVFAAQADVIKENYNVTTGDYKSFETKLKDLLTVKFSNKVDADFAEDDNRGEKVYNIKVTTSATAKEIEVTDSDVLSDVSKLIAKSNRGDVFTFTILDKGSVKNKEGYIVDKGEIEYTISSIADLNVEKGAAEVSGYTLERKYSEKDGSLELKYTNDKTNKVEYTKTLVPGMKVLDFKTPAKEDTLVKGFETLKTDITDKEYTVTVSNSKVEKITIDDKNIEDIAGKLMEQYEFSNLSDAKDQIVEVNGKFEVTLFATDVILPSISRAAVSAPENTIAQIVLKADKKSQLESVIDAMRKESGFNTIMGAERIDTAIELSKDTYQGTNKADNVVLVGQYAISDGLAAAPLAAQENAPILLTETNKLTKEVKDEIVRVMGLTNSTTNNSRHTVFIAGGEGVVSKEVEAELEALGVKVKRLAGADRYETSLKIADQMDNKRKAYVVDGYALADAMSIAPVAAKDEAPIVVVDGKNGLSTDAKLFLDKAYDAEVIGGKAVITEDTLDQVAKSTGNAERLAGEDRQETNAKVIAKHFENSNQYIVAKDGYGTESHLVDALAAAPLAKPIILATKGLTADQAIAVEKTKEADAKLKLTQVGNGVADSVIKQIKKLLSL